MDYEYYNDDPIGELINVQSVINLTRLDFLIRDFH